MLAIATFNLKGGTGKSTTVLNLGWAFTLSAGLRVLLIDLDGQRTLSHSLGFDSADITILDWLSDSGMSILPVNCLGLYAVPGDLGAFRLPADADISSCLKRIKGLVDIVLFDCPPGLGVGSGQALMAVDRILIPTSCEPAALKGVAEAIQLVRGERPKVPIDVLRTRYRKRLKLTRNADELLTASAQQFDYRLLETTIPDNSVVAEAFGARQSVLDYAPRSKGAEGYRALAREVANLWEI